MPDQETSQVQAAIAAVLDELPAIGKNQRNTQQNFSFRGIDDVLNALNPLLSKFKLFYMPTVLERETSERTTQRGGTMYVVNLHVRYTFYAWDGSSLVCDVWGEGTDSGDKATQKALTAAQKYMLFQVFSISTADQAAQDSEHHNPEDSSPSTPDDEARKQGYTDEANRKEVHDGIRPGLKKLVDADDITSTQAGILWSTISAQFPISKLRHTEFLNECKSAMESYAKSKEATDGFEQADPSDL